MTKFNIYKRISNSDLKSRTVNSLDDGEKAKIRSIVDKFVSNFKDKHI